MKKIILILLCISMIFIMFDLNVLLTNAAYHVNIINEEEYIASKDKILDLIKIQNFDSKYTYENIEKNLIDILEKTTYRPKELGGKIMPKKYRNSSSYSSTFDDGLIKYSIYRSAKGCLLYSRYVETKFFGDGSGNKLILNGNEENKFKGLLNKTIEELRDFVLENAQAGEQLRWEKGATHSINYIAGDNEGFYYINYLSDSDPYVYFMYTTWDNFYKALKKNRVSEFYIHDINQSKNLNSYSIEVIYHSSLKEDSTIKLFYNGNLINEETLNEMKTDASLYLKDGLMNGDDLLIMEKTGYTWSKQWMFENGNIIDQDKMISGTDLAKLAGITLNEGINTIHVYGVWNPNELKVIYHSGPINKLATSIKCQGNEISENEFIERSTSIFYYDTISENGLLDGNDPNGIYLEKEGYLWSGSWLISDENGKQISQNKSFTGKQLANILGIDLEKENKTIHVYGKWNPINYKINYDANGGIGTMSIQNISYDQKIELNLNQFTYEHNVFVGWNTKKDGTGDFYQDGMLIENLTNKQDDIIYLYAQWENENIVQYNVNHWLENEDGIYELKDTILLKGEIDELVTPMIKYYEGYTSPSMQSILLFKKDMNIDYYYSLNNHVNMK